MATNIVTVSGMFGGGHSYFANSPVVITVSGLLWPSTSPFNIVCVEVVYDGKTVGRYREDSGGQDRISFDISSALAAIWSDYDWEKEVSVAQNATSSVGSTILRDYREYGLRIYTEYLSDDDGGVFTKTLCQDESGNSLIPGGQCLVGKYTEWERARIGDISNADVSHLEHTNRRNGDASTKPVSTPERVGTDSITSWVDVKAGGTQSFFYPSHIEGASDSDEAHPPLVLRDSQPYTDFLFVNRRGALESCSALMLESLGIDVETTQYASVERPTFIPSRSLLSVNYGDRRTWNMSSGYLSREWVEWWVTEFLMSNKKWMRYQGIYVPVVVEPSKKSITIYDRSKQQMPSVEFTVKLALEG